ncbi:MAG: IclR family transcriptional regulator, partial [Thermoleophilia bacterium]|nr:IclR family transcriptional regulator [Thermoleophilia bacterium]
MGARRKNDSDEPSVRSVARAVSLLKCFTPDQPELTLAQLHTLSGLSKTTAHRLLATLEQQGMVEYDPRTTRYRLGLTLFQLGNVVAKSMDLVKQADPLLMKLAQETGDTTFLVVPDETETLCLRRFDGAHHVKVLFLEAGKRACYNCGSAQRVLLAHMPDDLWEEVVAHHTRRMTQYSLTTREELERDRREIRERGYAVSWEDVTLHACALGAPVRDATGKVIAAVSISGIVQRFSVERLPGLITTIMEL